ncbi:hypothetical protein LDENG_00224180, partial [Lucifuga dentata]
VAVIPCVHIGRSEGVKFGGVQPTGNREEEQERGSFKPLEQGGKEDAAAFWKDEDDGQAPDEDVDREPFVFELREKRG